MIGSRGPIRQRRPLRRLDNYGRERRTLGRQLLWENSSCPLRLRCGRPTRVQCPRSPACISERRNRQPVLERPRIPLVGGNAIPNIGKTRLPPLRRRELHHIRIHVTRTHAEPPSRNKPSRRLPIRLTRNPPQILTRVTGPPHEIQLLHTTNQRSTNRHMQPRAPPAAWVVHAGEQREIGSAFGARRPSR